MTDMNFLGNPTFYPPKEFSWQSEHFDVVSYKLRPHMSLLSLGYISIFRHSKKTLPNGCNTRTCMSYMKHAQKTVQTHKLLLQHQCYRTL